MTKIVTATLQWEIGDHVDPEAGSTITGVKTRYSNGDWYAPGGGFLTITSLEVKDKPREWKFGDEVTPETVSQLPDDTWTLVDQFGDTWECGSVPEEDADPDAWPMRLVYLNGRVEW